MRGIHYFDLRRDYVIVSAGWMFEPPRWTEWIGRGCMRATLRGRRQRRESCDFLNQIGFEGNTTERESDSILSCRSTLPLMISMACESWWLSYRANARRRWKNAGA